jgi:hypothetical protein
MVSSTFFDVPGHGTGRPADRSVYPRQLRHIAAAREGDEVPFQGTLVLCGPGRKRPKADDVRTSTEGSSPQSSSSQVGTWYAIAAHLTVSS